MIARRVRIWMLAVLVLAGLVLPASTAAAAETVHLYLKANGQDILGESTQISLGRENSIECVYFEQAITTAATGKEEPQYGAITCRKRIDKATPLLIKALITHQTIDAVIRFFRPNPTGDGTTEQFYTITVKGGRITSYRSYVPDTIVPASSSDPPLEEISFTYESVTWTFNNGGIEFGTDKARTGTPAAPDYKLKAQLKEKETVSLSWSAPTSQAGIKGYDVYRTTTQGATVSEQNRITEFSIEKTELVDRLKSGTYYYAVQAVQKDGTRLNPSDWVKVEVK